MSQIREWAGTYIDRAPPFITNQSLYTYIATISPSSNQLVNCLPPCFVVMHVNSRQSGWSSCLSKDDGNWRTICAFDKRLYWEVGSFVQVRIAKEGRCIMPDSSFSYVPSEGRVLFSSCATVIPYSLALEWRVWGLLDDVVVDGCCCWAWVSFSESTCCALTLLSCMTPSPTSRDRK